ncbi:MAG: alcohol dehydrogenase catalytic domain-containing protein [Gammaproteobacteria bacterium]|nr:MAG: galactitol-1-phosphate 5-dehydrogenase [Gammaproteobacteria bacterium]UCH40677.1 MAG: alcohol dehydrogenase catalytic domain-containing protein [Gammaproteobacteria bacterium]
MKALVYTANEEMTYRDEPDPDPQPGDALIAIESVGICGSDMHAYLGHDERRVPPLILGHEAVGTVLEGSKAGRRVVLNPLITCGVCNECLGGRQNLCAERDLIGMYRAGAFAEKIAIPERNLIPVPDGMPSAHAALTEPGATGLHAILLAERVLSRPLSESRALVLGAGSVGLLTALLLRDKGVDEVVVAETNPLRRELVSQHCDFELLDPLQQQPQEMGFDCVFDAVGGEATRAQAIVSTRSGGVIVHIGLMDNRGSMDVRAMTLREITFIGTYTYTPVDLRATLAKLNSGALGGLGWLEQRPLEAGAEAFAELLQGRCAAPKVVLGIDS